MINVVGSQRKFEIAYFLGSLLEKGRAYSTIELESVIRNSVKTSIINEPGFRADHLRVAMVDNNILKRNSKNSYWLSEGYAGFTDEFSCGWLKIVEKEKNCADIKMKCPVCSKKAYPYIIQRHYKAKHTGEYKKDIYTSEFLRNGWVGRVDKYFKLILI